MVTRSSFSNFNNPTYADSPRHGGVGRIETSPQIIVPVLKDKSHSTRADEDETTMLWRLDALARQEKLAAMKRRFFRTDIPLSLFGAGAGYLFYRLNNSENQVVQDFAKLIKHRDAALGQLKQVVETGFNRPFGQTLLHPESTGTIGRLQMALSLGETPDQVIRVANELKLKNPTSGVVRNLEQQIQGYSAMFQRVVTNATGLQKLAIPVVARTVGTSPEGVKSMVRHNPHRFIKSLLSKGLTNPRYSETFFNKLFTELGRATNLMAFITAFSVGVGLVGIFITRLELAQKRAHQA